MYDLMYVDTITTPVEEYYSATKTFDENYKKISTSGPASKHWLGITYIYSVDYELDMKLDEIEEKIIRPHIK